MSNTQKQLALAKAAKKSANTADTEEKNRALLERRRKIFWRQTVWIWKRRQAKFPKA